MHTANNPVQAVERALRILESVQEHDGLTLAELEELLDISKGAVHNHCSTLREHGYLVKDGDEYVIGMRFFEMGEYAKRRKRIYEVGVPEVEELAAETEELGNLLIEEHGQGIYLHRAYGEHALQLDTGVGSRVHLHSTALGKAILAHLPEPYVDSVLDAYGLPAYTEHTITDREEFKRTLEETRERGYAVDLEERAEGVKCVAAVVKTSDDKVLGAVSVAGPIGRMESGRMHDEIAERVQNAARVAGINATYL